MTISNTAVAVLFDLLLLIQIGLALFFLLKLRPMMQEQGRLIPVLLSFAVFGALIVTDLATYLLPPGWFPAFLGASQKPVWTTVFRGFGVVALLLMVSGVYRLASREMEIIQALSRTGKPSDRHAITADRLASVLDQAQQIARMGSWEWNLADDSLRYSDGLLRLYGMDREKQFASFADFESAIHPDDREISRETLRRAAAGESGSMQYRVVWEDGQVRTLQAQVDVDQKDDRPTVVRATLIDITEQVAAEERNRFSTALHRAVVNSTFDGIVIFDSDAKIDLFNRTAERLYGYTSEEMAGESALKLLPEDCRASFNEAFQRYLENGEGSLIGEGPFETEACHKSGDRIPVELAIRDVEVDGNRLFVATVRDISQRRLQEEQLRRAQKLQAVGQLTGGVAHDFNNIITSIMGNLDLLRESVSDRPVAARFADEALTSAGRAATLTQQLLAFSRRQALRPEPVDVNQLVSRGAELLRNTLGANINIQLDLEPELWRTMVDESQLESALLNLTFNARDAMPDGGMLTLRTENYRQHGDDPVAGIAAGDYVALTVVDTGSGMSKEVQTRVFEPFFTTKEVGKGSGLGLSMVYGFVRQTGGFLDLRSEEGAGTTISLFLPQTDRTVQTDEVSPARGESESRGAGSERLLVVEDDDAVRSFLQLALEVQGYEVLACADGEAALDILEAVGSVDLVLTDVMLPGMTGAELGERIRAEHPETPVLFSSGYTRDEMIKNGRLAPDVHLIEKPFRREELIAEVREMLDAS